MLGKAKAKSKNDRKEGVKGLTKYLWKHKYMYLMLVPAIVYYVIFCYVPMYGA